jgi:predicted RNA binding protein YcfA (HicA-like mRNA interferase family)
MTPRLPRDVSGEALISALADLGYLPTRRSGSHVRLTTSSNGVHHVTVPVHRGLKVGTLSGILAEVAGHLEISKTDLIARLFG